MQIKKAEVLSLMAVMGIDLGTSAVKVLILDVQGQVLGRGRADYPVLSRQAGWAESDPEVWWQATLTAVRIALLTCAGSRITALGLSGQMHGVVLTSQLSQPLHNALLWADNRAQEELLRYDRLPADATGCLANPRVAGMAGPLLCWLAVHEREAYQAARWALQPKDWLRLRLTGQAATDPGDASATLLYNLFADSWASNIIAQLGLRPELFAPILSSGAVAGYLLPQVASELGLPAGLPVATGSADTAAAALGAGLLVPGSVQLTLGTGAQLIQLQRVPTVDPALRTHLYRAADGVHWYSMAAVQNAGLALDWVRRTLNVNWEELYGSANPDYLGGSELMFLPYVSQERAHVPGTARGGVFTGVYISHQRAHLCHAALIGVACNIRVAFDALPGNSNISSLRLVGGGSVHPAWRQLLANILGRDLVVLDVTDASVRGAALLAGLADKTWSDLSDIASLAPQPHLTIHSADSRRYAEIYNNYLHLSEKLTPFLTER